MVNAALILRLGLPSTLISYKDGTFRKKTSFKPEKFENAGLEFSCGLKTF